MITMMWFDGFVPVDYMFQWAFECEAPQEPNRCEAPARRMETEKQSFFRGGFSRFDFKGKNLSQVFCLPNCSKPPMKFILILLPEPPIQTFFASLTIQSNFTNEIIYYFNNPPRFPPKTPVQSPFGPFGTWRGFAPNKMRVRWGPSDQQLEFTVYSS
eukprot:TRINITY_DN9323_c0_g1_i2.p2 TRINITY_DN9323_c0_g1~~TRINITY_DN9323_c0_g1_i2.p2  ORF type:complete len:157 (-),score=10.52 TRINITY_DN9323_c0_g1_i2:296-766(-)